MNQTDQNTSGQLQDIQLILRDLLKVIKVVAMYPEDNPLPQSLKRTFSERLVDLVADHGPLDFKIDRENLYFADEIAFTDRSAEESLAGLFFDTGIVRITFKTGLDIDDVYRLLEALKTHQNVNRHSSDLAAILWEAGIPHFQFETVEDISLRQLDDDMIVQAISDSDSDSNYQQFASDNAESYESIFNFEEDADAGDDAGDDAFADDQSVIESADLTNEGLSPLSTGNTVIDEAIGVNEATEAMGLDNSTEAPRLTPNTALILNDAMKLSEEELVEVKRLVTADANFDPFESTCELLKEILHQESEMNDFYESVTIGEKVLNEFVARGKLTFAADLLRYFSSLDDQIRKDRPMWAERLKVARVTAGSRERLRVLCNALNADAEIGSLELRRYLDNFNWEALMGITDMLGDLEHRLHHDAVRDYLTLRGKDRVHIVAKGIHDKRPNVVSASVMILARIGDSTALQQLEKVTEHDEVEVRRTMAASLTECPNDDSLRILRKLVGDSDADVRQTAVQAIVARRGQPAFDTLTEILNDDQFYNLSRTDQESVLIAYSILGGDAAVDYLLRLAEKPNLFNNDDLAFYRAAAFEALAHNRGDKAERCLVRLSGSWRSDLKTSAKAALRKRRELIYGGTDE